MNETVVHCKSETYSGEFDDVVMTSVVTSYNQHILLLSKIHGEGHIAFSLHIATYRLSQSEIRDFANLFAHRPLEPMLGDAKFSLGFPQSETLAALCGSHVEALTSHMRAEGEKSIQLHAYFALQVAKFLGVSKPIQFLSNAFQVPSGTLNRRVANAKLKLSSSEGR